VPEVALFLVFVDMPIGLYSHSHIRLQRSNLVPTGKFPTVVRSLDKKRFSFRLPFRAPFGDPRLSASNPLPLRTRLAASLFRSDAGFQGDAVTIFPASPLLELRPTSNRSLQRPHLRSSLYLANHAKTNGLPLPSAGPPGCGCIEVCKSWLSHFLPDDDDKPSFPSSDTHSLSCFF